MAPRRPPHPGRCPLLTGTAWLWLQLWESQRGAGAQVAEADLAPYLERVRDGALRHALEYGVAFLHETQAPAEQEVVNTLFASGAIQARAGGKTGADAFVRFCSVRCLRPSPARDVLLTLYRKHPNPTLRGQPAQLPAHVAPSKPLFAFAE